MKAGYGFKDARFKVINALLAGDFQHEARNDIDVKNLLATGEITPHQLAALLRHSNGAQHRCSPHHVDRSIIVHVIITKGWYVKFFFLEPDTWFISVHR